MARGKRTELVTALAAKAMAELGYWPGLIAEVLGLSPTTVNDIIEGHGPWQELSCNAQFEAIKARFKVAMEEAAERLAIQAIARLEEKIKNASIMEALAIFEALSRRGG